MGLSSWDPGGLFFLDIGESGKVTVTSHQFQPNSTSCVHIHSSRVSPRTKGLNLPWIGGLETGALDTETRSGMTLGKFESRSGSDSAGSYPKLVSVLSPEF